MFSWEADGTRLRFQPTVPSCFIAKTIFKSSVLLSEFILYGLIPPEICRFLGDNSPRGEPFPSVRHVLKEEQCVFGRMGSFILLKVHLKVCLFRRRG